MSDHDRDALIQAVLDGTATPDEAAQLKQLAGADIELGERKASYRALFDALNHMPVADAPKDLRANVLAAIEGHAVKAPEPAKVLATRTSTGSRGRLVFATATALVAAMLGYAAWRGAPRTAVPPSAPVTGTMAPAGRTPTPEASASPWTLGQTVVEGYLIREGDAWRATLNIRGADPVRVDLIVDPRTCEVLSVVPGAGGRRLTSDAPEGVALELVAPGRAEITLRSPGAQAPEVQITLRTPTAGARGRLEERPSPEIR